MQEASSESHPLPQKKKKLPNPNPSNLKEKLPLTGDRGRGKRILFKNKGLIDKTSVRRG
jgi:hypothetical protein